MYIDPRVSISVFDRMGERDPATRRRRLHVALPGAAHVSRVRRTPRVMLYAA
jgi:hypothetical protein